MVCRVWDSVVDEETLCVIDMVTTNSLGKAAADGPGHHSLEDSVLAGHLGQHQVECCQHLVDGARDDHDAVAGAWVQLRDARQLDAGRALGLELCISQA